MFCKNCGQEIPDDSKFCRFCGACSVQPTEPKLEQSAVCSNCGKELSEGVRFCKFCGAPVSLKSEDEALHKTEMAEIDPQASEPEESTDESGNDDSTYPNQQENISPAAGLPSSYFQPAGSSNQRQYTYPPVADIKAVKNETVKTSVSQVNDTPDTPITKKNRLSKRGKVVIIISAAVVFMAFVLCLFDDEGIIAEATKSCDNDAGAVMNLTLDEFSQKFNDGMTSMYSDIGYTNIEFNINQYWNNMVEPVSDFETTSGCPFTTYSAFVVNEYLVSAKTVNGNVETIRICFDYDDNDLPRTMSWGCIKALSGLSTEDSKKIVETLNNGIMDNTMIYKSGILYSIDTSTVSYCFFAASARFVERLEQSGKCNVIYY